MKSTVYGYIRVSTKEQCEDRQLLALSEFPVMKKTFIWTNLAEKILIDQNIEAFLEG